MDQDFELLRERDESIEPFTFWQWERGVGAGHVDHESPDALLHALSNTMLIDVPKGFVRLWVLASNVSDASAEEKRVYQAALRILTTINERRGFGGLAPVNFRDRILAEVRRYRERYPASDYRRQFDRALETEIITALRGAASDDGGET